MNFFAVDWKKKFNLIVIGLAVATALVAVIVAKLNFGYPLLGWLRFFLFIGIATNVVSVFKPQFFDNLFSNSANGQALINFVKSIKDIENLTPKNKEVLKKHIKDNLSLFQVEKYRTDVVEEIIRVKDASALQILLESGFDPFAKVDPRYSLLERMIVWGHADKAKIVAEVVAKQPKMMIEHGIKESILIVLKGDMNQITQLDKAKLEEKTPTGIQCLHAAVLLHLPKEIVEHIVKSGADLNKDIFVPGDTGKKANALQLSLNYTVGNSSDDNALVLIASGKAKLAADSTFADAMLLALANGYLKAAKSMEKAYDWSTIYGGKTAIDCAKLSNNLAVVEYATKMMNAAGLLQGSNSSSAPASNTRTAPQASASQTVVNRQLTLDEILTNISMSLDGLVGMDKFVDTFGRQIHSFYNKKPKSSVGIVIWGDASVGKSSIGKRLSGLMNEVGIPGLDLAEVPFEYHALTDTTKQVPEILNDVKSGSIVFFDEIDKFFDPNSQMVSPQEANKIKSQIITNFDKKPILWVFAGTFANLRGKVDLNQDLLLKLLGSELNSRLEFGRWKIDSWTEDKIFQAAEYHIEKEFGEKFDDEAIILICSKAIQAEGGFREFEKHARALSDINDQRGEKVVTKAFAEEYFKKLSGG